MESIGVKKLESIGEYLKEYRENKGLSIRRLAEITNVSASYISQIENNRKSNASSAVLKTLFDAIGVDYFQLLAKVGEIDEIEAKRRRENYLKATENLLESNLADLDLKIMLTGNALVYYDGRLLTKEEKRKINNLITTLLE